VLMLSPLFDDSHNLSIVRILRMESHSGLVLGSLLDAHEESSKWIPRCRRITSDSATNTSVDRCTLSTVASDARDRDRAPAAVDLVGHVGAPVAFARVGTVAPAAAVRVGTAAPADVFLVGHVGAAAAEARVCAADPAAVLTLASAADIRASVHACAAALSYSLFKTKARDATTVNTYCDMGCDCVIAVYVDVREGDKYKVLRGTGVAVE
jgi:hypothetical protein